MRPRVRVMEPYRTRYKTGLPRRGEKVWQAISHDGSRGRNGIIAQVEYETKEVIVLWLTTGQVESYSFDDLEGCWTDKFGGTYILELT